MVNWTIWSVSLVNWPASEGQTDLTGLLETKYGDYKKNEALTLDHLDSGRYDDDYKHFKSVCADPLF